METIELTATTDCNSNNSEPRYSKKYDHLIEETRRQLQTKLTTKKEYIDSYYPLDLTLAMEEDYRIRRFLLKNSGSVSSAVSGIISTFQWIKKKQLRDLKDSDFPREIHLLGSMFLYQPDLSGRKVFYMRHKHNSTIKDIYEMKVQYMAYQLLKASDASGETGFILITDLSDTPWSRIEFSLLNFFLQLAQHFPYGVALALYVDLPSLAQGAYKVFKYTLPPEIRSTLDLISRDQLTKYIDINNIPPFLGGKCRLEYSGPSMVPKDALSLVQYGLAKGIKESVIIKVYKFYRKEIEQLAQECSWSNSDLWNQLDASLSKLNSDATVRTI